MTVAALVLRKARNGVWSQRSVCYSLVTTRTSLPLSIPFKRLLLESTAALARSSLCCQEASPMSKPKSPRLSSRKPTTAGRIIKANVNTDFQLLNEHAAGIDIGAERHYVAVGPSASPHPVREFSVFTKDLYAIADWLASCGVKSVAMESTGVYWVPLL